MSSQHKLSVELSDALKVCNVLCTILVVAIHFNTKSHIDFSAGFTFNYYVQEFITNGLARIAVPFFALASGFFFFKNYVLSAGTFSKSIRKRTSSLVIPYLIGASVILLSELVYAKQITVSQLSLINAFDYLFVKPLSVQFWFLRDLFCLTIISPLIYFCISKLKVLFVLICMGLWLFDVELAPTWGGRYLISIEVGAFFVLGAYLYQHAEKLDEFLEKIPLLLMFGVSISVLCYRIYIDPTMSNWYHDNYSSVSLLLQNVYILLGIIAALSFAFKIKHNAFLKWLAPFTFFVYIYHLLPLSRVVVKLSDYVISDAYKFYVTVPLSLILTFSLAIVFSKVAPRVYNFVSGGR